ncbi:hypothetical protein LACR_2578 [Lactococcus cremoris subsp. cremoris SK11]|uniref:Uncharacterized protein n=1 Tax=Lactococcus lactis subsp. cremoris (strain SK11) TaxID=272622 RepID=Q02VM6_LACLS|nr:hypothetical protein [Lactococcus cremoris]EQC56321.1 hypothetical protein LLT5_01600 [Lactococcus cremoris subsp. cremoris TIFN5]ABJ73996.1 hypothetical protein LACR_2578 [Lactococcus cremoris subsp. cremoris SK11]KZK51466.1 hypothetical protein AM2_2352 [Lactococcus cremoris]MCT4409391.1 hypothetical protein [Lactococcus cremoris]MCT4416646.1 hypothetical protein [Lactococcus cremoris]
MAKTNWNKTLGEVLNQQTQQKVMVSEKTGKEYTTEVVPSLNVLSIGSLEEVDGKFKYAVVDTANDLEYIIKAPNKVELKFGTQLQFKYVRGGVTTNGMGWFAADSVAVVQRNA